MSVTPRRVIQRYTIMKEENLRLFYFHGLSWLLLALAYLNLTYWSSYVDFMGTRQDVQVALFLLSVMVFGNCLSTLNTMLYTNNKQTRKKYRSKRVSLPYSINKSASSSSNKAPAKSRHYVSEKYKSKRVSLSHSSNKYTSPPSSNTLDIGQKKDRICVLTPLRQQHPLRGIDYPSTHTVAIDSQLSNSDRSYPKHSEDQYVVINTGMECCCIGDNVIDLREDEEPDVNRVTNNGELCVNSKRQQSARLSICVENIDQLKDSKQYNFINRENNTLYPQESNSYPGYVNKSDSGVEQEKDQEQGQCQRQQRKCQGQEQFQLKGQCQVKVEGQYQEQDLCHRRGQSQGQGQSGVSDQCQGSIENSEHVVQIGLILVIKLMLVVTALHFLFTMTHYVALYYWTFTPFEMMVSVLSPLLVVFLQVSLCVAQFINYAFETTAGDDEEKDCF